MIDPTLYGSTGGNVWDFARQEYLAGVTATTICQRYGMSMSSFRAHARVGGWRRMDQPGCDALPEDGEFHPDDEVGFGDLADQVFMNIRRAIGTRRAAEAASWMRLYDKLCDKGRPDAMAALPDRDMPQPPAPEPDPRQYLTTNDGAAVLPDAAGGANASDCNTTDTDETPHLDFLDSVFSESNPAPDPVARAEPVAEPVAGLTVASEPDLDSVDSVFPESNCDPVAGVKPLSERERAVVVLARAQQMVQGEDVSPFDDILSGVRPFPIPVDADGRRLNPVSP